jgi:imidazolonepropionase-like amidohydrolase
MTRILAAFSVVALATLALSAQSAVTVFENGRVIVGDGTVLENATIVVSGERIQQVGPAP